MPPRWFVTERDVVVLSCCDRQRVMTRRASGIGTLTAVAMARQVQQLQTPVALRRRSSAATPRVPPAQTESCSALSASSGGTLDPTLRHYRDVQIPPMATGTVQNVGSAMSDTVRLT